MQASVWVLYYGNLCEALSENFHTALKLVTEKFPTKDYIVGANSVGKNLRSSDFVVYDKNLQKVAQIRFSH